MSDANVSIIGNVASDVQSYPTNNGGVVSSFRLASRRRYLNRRTGRWVEEDASFYRIVCWRSLAENVRDCVKKGEPVIVQGRLKLKDWTDDDGRTRTDAEIDAWSVAYDLMRGTAQFNRTRRQAPATGGNDPLDHIRSEQRARADDEVIVDPDTGEVFNVSQLHRERAADEASPAWSDEKPGSAEAAGPASSESESESVSAEAEEVAA